MPGKIARLGFARRLADKFYDTLTEIKWYDDTITDDQGAPIGGYVHRAWTRCRLDAPTMFSGVQLQQSGGAGGPIINVVQWTIQFPVDPRDPSKVRPTDMEGNYTDDPPFVIDPTDVILADGRQFNIRGARGPITWETKRQVDADTIGEVPSRG